MEVSIPATENNRYIGSINRAEVIGSNNDIERFITSIESDPNKENTYNITIKDNDGKETILSAVQDFEYNKKQPKSIIDNIKYTNIFNDIGEQANNATIIYFIIDDNLLFDFNSQKDNDDLKEQKDIIKLIPLTSIDIPTGSKLIAEDNKEGKLPSYVQDKYGSISIVLNATPNKDGKVKVKLISLGSKLDQGELNGEENENS
ncbi:hypothetical protein [uncultured Clostridium sp.]|uniref:hypothetical protein n=1 Tax=uncultured Clostridium sp. TaxID=59620 RepID=UPI00261E3F7A|nr:hypothetical protein [uncultured Clostridium sp.]